MKKLSSLTISIILHVIILLGLFFAYKTVKKLTSTQKKEEKIICVKLNNCIKEKKASKTQKKKIEKEIKKTKPKVIKKPKPIKKKIIRKKTKPKKAPPKKKIPKEKKVIKPPKKEIKKPIKKETKQIIKQEKTSTNKTEIKKVAKQAKKQPLALPKQTQKVKTKNYQKEYIDKNIQKIRELISQNIYYPRKARRRHIQGKVVLKFTLTKNAKIKDIKVLSSSYDILTNAAKEVLGMIESDLPKPKEDITITLPINYTLR